MAYYKSAGELMNELRKLKKKEEKVKFLKENATPVLIGLLKAAYEPAIVWQLPEGNPPYKPLEKSQDQQGALANEMRRMYLFWEGGNPNLKQARREALFIQLLESIDPDDAELLLEVKSGKIQGLTKAAVMEAFPNLLDGQW